MMIYKELFSFTELLSYSIPPSVYTQLNARLCRFIQIPKYGRGSGPRFQFGSQFVPRFQFGSQFVPRFQFGSQFVPRFMIEWNI